MYVHTCSGLGRAWILSCKDGVSTVPMQNFKFSVKNHHQQSWQKVLFSGSVESQLATGSIQPTGHKDDRRLKHLPY